MPSADRGVVRALLIAVAILILGLLGLLVVAYSRSRQCADEIKSLRILIREKDAQIDRLKKDRPLTVPPPDTSWGTPPAPAPW